MNTGKHNRGHRNAERTLPHTPVSHWLSGQRGEARAKVHIFKQNELTKEHHKVIREGKDKARLKLERHRRSDALRLAVVHRQP